LLSTSNETAFQQEKASISLYFQNFASPTRTWAFFNGAEFALVDAAYAPLFMQFALMGHRCPLNLFSVTPALRRWSEALLALPAVQESVVTDFATPFYRCFAQHGGHFARYCQ